MQDSDSNSGSDSIGVSPQERTLLFFTAKKLFTVEQCSCTLKKKGQNKKTHTYSKFDKRFLLREDAKWLLTDDAVEHRNVLKSNYYLYHRICLTINKIVYYQHLLASFEELLSLRLRDHFALVVGCIINNWLDFCWNKLACTHTHTRARTHTHTHAKQGFDEHLLDLHEYTGFFKNLSDLNQTVPKLFADAELSQTHKSDIRPGQSSRKNLINVFDQESRKMSNSSDALHFWSETWFQRTIEAARVKVHPITYSFLSMVPWCIRRMCLPLVKWIVTSTGWFKFDKSWHVRASNSCSFFFFFEVAFFLFFDYTYRSSSFSRPVKAPLPMLEILFPWRFLQKERHTVFGTIQNQSSVLGLGFWCGWANWSRKKA